MTSREIISLFASSTVAFSDRLVTREREDRLALLSSSPRRLAGRVSDEKLGERECGLTVCIGGANVAGSLLECESIEALWLFASSSFWECGTLGFFWPTNVVMLDNFEAAAAMLSPPLLRAFRCCEAAVSKTSLTRFRFFSVAMASVRNCSSDGRNLNSPSQSGSGDAGGLGRAERNSEDNGRACTRIVGLCTMALGERTSSWSRSTIA